MTPVLGTVEEQLQVAQAAALRFFRERNDYRARHETSLEVIRAREQHVEILRLEVKRLRKALLCPQCHGKGRVAVFGFIGINWMDCRECEAAQIRKEARENEKDKKDKKVAVRES
jgi:Zn ribbon nucleic-acid-binding protein